ncbi:hypothetical protein Salat_1667300 [Sesamum alatum]|uniref:Uncharacterized protein n=1 Tax=Sesamum alatum TaxID=300844 RepID=A0AAE1Y7E9_9LAMI|nr:hypothetical protein Salat_1667300 [Sesamum alatum]
MPDHEGLSFGQRNLNYMLEKNLEIDFYEEKLHLLRKRYTTFKAILDDPAYHRCGDANGNSSRPFFSQMKMKMAMVVKRSQTTWQDPVPMEATTMNAISFSWVRPLQDLNQSM